VIAHIAGYGFVDQTLSDVETALGEALANAAEHGHRAGSGFEVRIFIERDMLVIEVQDDGLGFISPDIAATSPAHDAPRGFGIYLMRHLMDQVDFTMNGTCVRLAKRLPLARAQGENVG
jgi:serine/threonine-protein kinase RsbW